MDERVGRKERDAMIVSPPSLSLSLSFRLPTVSKTSSATIDDSINRGYSRVNRDDRDYFIRAMNGR